MARIARPRIAKQEVIHSESEDEPRIPTRRSRSGIQTQTLHTKHQFHDNDKRCTAQQNAHMSQSLGTVPDRPTLSQSPCKQIRLGFAKSTGIWPDSNIPSPAEERLPRRKQTPKTIHLSRFSSLKPPTDIDDGRRNPDLRLAARVKSLATVSVNEVESDFKDSDEIPSSSDERLPSLREIIKRKPPQTSVVKQIAEPLDVTTLLQGLSLTNTGAPPDIHDLHEPVRIQLSETDIELDGPALLKFSPPRVRTVTPDEPSTPPMSPTKSKLLSPSKRPVRIPTPPGGPSLDTFWDAETVNHWNDQYSPRKEWKTTRSTDAPSDEQSRSPSASPQKRNSPSKRTKAELEARRHWDASKHRIATEFLDELDTMITKGQIKELSASTGGVKIIWSKTLNSTAGRANWKRETTKTRDADGGVVHASDKHFASIELAEKVIDNEERLVNVLAHEFCHLCNFMISGIKDQPHGRQFKEWGRQTTKAFSHRGIKVTTKHSYQIEYKYIWQCSNANCGIEFKRHSKSIDPIRHTCGSCHGKLMQIKPVPRKNAGSPAKGYAAFVKRHFAEIKKGLPGATQKEIMEAVGQKYRAEKSASAVVPSLVHESVEEFEDDQAQNLDGVARKLEFVILDS